MKRPTAGLTLIELLVGLALVGIVLATLLSLTIGTARPSAALQARNDLLPELQTAQNYMAGKLKQAAYVFPVGANIQLSVNGSTTAKPDGTQNWVVGDTAAPIVAFIVPPKAFTPGQCAGATTLTASDLCYSFYAFYPMKRDVYLNAVTGADDPGNSSPSDSTSWVLLEYRGYYSAFAPNPIVPLSGFGTPTALEIPSSNRGRILMDYLQPTTAVTPLFSEANVPAAALSQQRGIANVTMNLAAFQSVGGQSVRVPVGATYNTLTVYPQNIGKPQLLN